MLDELAKILLFPADQLAATASRSAAAAFIGFHLDDDERAFSHVPVSRVDLRRFPISPKFL